MTHGHVHSHTPHHLYEEGGGHDWIEIAAAILLALATIASAWSAYQSARWGGVEAKLFASANATRVESTKAADLADQQIATDIETWMLWIEAVGTGEQRVAEYYREKVFSEELKVAAEAWLNTDPQNNPDAPDTPFDMKEYSNVNLEKSEELDAQADEEMKEAREAVERSDIYVLFTVLFASVLFFAGISTKFGARKVRIAIVCMGASLFVGSIIAVVLQPIH